MGNRGDRAAIVAVALAVASIVAYLPDGFLRWTFPKFFVMAVAVAVAAWARRTGCLPRWAWWCAGAGAAALIAGAVAGQIMTGTDVWAGLFGRWPRYLGPLTALPVGVGAAWLGASLLGPSSDPAPRRAFVIAAASAAWAITILSALETLGLRPIASDLERPGSLLGNATDQGIVSVMILMVTLAVALLPATRADRLMRIFAPLGAVGAALAVTLSASRGAYVAAVVGLLATALLMWRTRLLSGRRVALTIGGMGVLLVAAVVALPGALARVIGVDSVAAATVGERWTLWERGLQVFATSPLVGGGAGSFVDRVPAFHDAAWFVDRPINTVLESAHNWILDAGADGGLVLIAIIAIACVLLARRAAQRIMTDSGDRGLVIGASAGLLSAAVALLAHPTGPSVFLLIGLLAGILIGVPTAAGRGFGGAPRTIAVRASLAVWALLLLLATLAEVPIADGASQTGGAVAGSTSFSTATALRGLDPEIAAIAAQSMTAAMVAGDTAAQQEALYWTAEAIRRLPLSRAILDARATTLENAGDWSEAAAVRTRMTELAPRDVVARLDLAIDLAVGGEYARALTEAQQVLDERPDLQNAQVLIDQICDQTTALTCQ